MRAPFCPVRPAVFSPEHPLIATSCPAARAPPGAGRDPYRALNHADGAVGYRLESDGRVIAISPITSTACHGRCHRRAPHPWRDLLVIDAHLHRCRNTRAIAAGAIRTWQHATAPLPAAAGQAAGPVFHHRPRRATPSSCIEQEARQAFPDTIVACDDLEITL